MNDDTNPTDPSSPQVQDEENYQGSMPNPDLVEEDDTLDEANSMGLYQNSDEEHPSELNIAEEIQKDEEDRLEND